MLIMHVVTQLCTNFRRLQSRHHVTHIRDLVRVRLDQARWNSLIETYRSIIIIINIIIIMIIIIIIVIIGPSFRVASACVLS